MKRIRIEVIPHAEQRYNTAGDYYFDEVSGDWVIRVSDLGREDYNICVAIHELVELIATRKRGIAEQAIHDFDLEFEKRRERGEVTGEAGHDPSAPYHDEHVAAEEVEKLTAAALAVDWKEYANAVDDIAGTRT